jgi:hypothetical protein
VPEPKRLARRRASVAGILTVLMVAAALLAPSPGSAAPVRPGGYEALPIEYGRELLGNLSGPSLVAGSSGSLTFTVEDPLSTVLEAPVLTLEVYAFNAFPGNSTSTVPVAGAPVLTTATSSGAAAIFNLSALAPGAVYHGDVGVSTSSSSPSGTFAVRAELSFNSGGTPYLLESRGWFTSAAWAAATELPNGSVTLNLTRLGVSGVLPETAVYVSSAGFDWALGILAGAGIVLVGAGAWVYFRRGARSRSGTR